MNIQKEKIETELQLLIDGVISKEEAVEEIAAYIRWMNKAYKDTHNVIVSFLYNFVNEFTDTEISKEAIKESLDKINER